MLTDMASLLLVSHSEEGFEEGEEDMPTESSSLC